MIAIVGGGLTGLALGHHLRAAGTPHVVLEAEPRAGGVIRSARVEGRVLEWGPQRARLTDDLATLVRELGLEPELIRAPRGLPLYVYTRGRLRRVPFSAVDFLRTDLLRWPAKLRLLLEPLTAGPRAEESVASFFTRKLGREAYESLAGPLYGGLYASRPEDMVVGLSLGHVLRELGLSRSLLLPLLRRGGSIAPPDACSFRDGLQALTNALYEGNHENVRLASPVRGLGGRPGRWRLELDGGEILAGDVVLSVPAHAAAGLLREVAPAAAERIGRLNYNPLGVVHLCADTELQGLGYQVGLAERLATRGVTFNDSLFERDGVYTAYLGGAKSPEVLDLPDAELGELAVREFREVTGYDARPLAVAREQMPAWDASWAALRWFELPAGVHLAANWESRPGIPGRLAQARRLAAQLAAG